MKFFLLLFLNLSIYLLGQTGNLYAQVNLVPNPSFEIYDTCPSSSEFPYGGINHAIPWFQPYFPENSTDYFNPCSPNTFPSVSSPSNYEGFQIAKTGVSYSGFSTGILVPQNNYREYLEVKLIDSLISNKKYCISFYVSFANNSRRSIDGLGAYLSQNIVVYSSPNWGVLNNLLPQVENPIGNVINDTLNWVEVSGEFIAIGGEKYLTIGNFKDDAHTTMVQNNYGIHFYSYYYIDDVSVVYCDSNVGLNENDWESNISISPNPVKDIFTLNNLPKEIASIFVYNLQGKILLKQEFTTSDKSAKQVNVSALSAGIYFVKVVTEKGTVARKFLKE